MRTSLVGIHVVCRSAKGEAEEEGGQLELIASLAARCSAVGHTPLVDELIVGAVVHLLCGTAPQFRTCERDVQYDDWRLASKGEGRECKLTIEI